MAARFNGDRTDITYRSGLVAVVDGNSMEGVSHLSTFRVDESGNLAPEHVVTISGVATNVVILGRDDDFQY